MVVVILEKVKERWKLWWSCWNLWWFTWRWRRRKMKEKGWRSCSGGCGGGDEEELVEVLA